MNARERFSQGVKQQLAGQAGNSQPAQPALLFLRQYSGCCAHCHYWKVHGHGATNRKHFDNKGLCHFEPPQNSSVPWEELHTHIDHQGRREVMLTSTDAYHFCSHFRQVEGILLADRAEAWSAQQAK